MTRVPHLLAFCCVLAATALFTRGLVLARRSPPAPTSNRSTELPVLLGPLPRPLDGRSADVTVNRLALGLRSATIRALVGDPVEEQHPTPLQSVWRYRDLVVTFDATDRVSTLVGTHLYVDSTLVLEPRRPADLSRLQPRWRPLGERAVRTPVGMLEWLETDSLVERVKLTRSPKIR